MLEANKQRVREFFDAVYRDRRIDAVYEYVASDVRERNAFPGFPGSKGSGREALAHWLGSLLQGFPDLRCEITWMIAEGDAVVVAGRLVGTNDGPMWFPPTGKRIDVPTVDIVRLEQGRIVDHLAVIDTGAVLVQLGLVPEAAGAT